MGIMAAVPAQAADLSDRLKGYFLLSVEDHGKIWYVYPETGARIHVADAPRAWELIKSNMIGITNADLNELPLPGEAPSAKGKELKERLSGRFLLAVESHGEVWYMNPHTGYIHYLGTGEATYDIVKNVALGATLKDINTISPVDVSTPKTLEVIQEQVEETVAPEPISVPEPIVENVDLDTVAYTNSALGYEFASTLFDAYTKYFEAGNHYPEIKWFENVFEFNQPIYFDTSGFTLAASEDVYWVWTDLSPEFMKMYRDHFTFTVDGQGELILSIDLPEDLVTSDRGALSAGTYHFTSAYGFLTDEQYAKVENPVFVFSLQGVDLEAEAARVIEQVLEVQTALNRYSGDIFGGYPALTNHSINLGEDGRTVLSERGGFHPLSNPGKIYLTNIKSGAPTTHITYDSRIGGKSYVITFDLYGSYRRYQDVYTPGKYELTPGGIQRVGNLTD